MLISRAPPPGMRDVDELISPTLEIDSVCESAQIEVGGPFVGIEMHHGSPLLHRISLFYPVANSIDLSMDYWQRSESRVTFLGLKVGCGPKEWVGLEPFGFRLTPYSVMLHTVDERRAIRVSYQFCKEKPAMVTKLEITNSLAEPESFEVYTHLEASLRTSHTYALVDKAWTEFHEAGSAIYVNFDDAAAGNAQVFVANAGEQPTSFATDSETLGLPPRGNWWMDKVMDLPGEVIGRASPGRPAAAFLYRKQLDPGQKLTVVQMLGSCRWGEGREIVGYLLDHYEHQIGLYEGCVLSKAHGDGVVRTGDRAIDHSALWAKAVLAANAHYLHGEVVPMPCPAEYNFYFTHDVLLTDLAAVHFDLARVRRDLEYIVAKADDTLPHACYWKDDRYVIEFAGADNWNHFWFILVSASYLRHSGDIETLQRLYPHLTRSLKLAMTSRGEDDLMWARHPDWWDIGHSFGPRAYMTILAIRALREFTYVCTVLDKEISQLLQYEELAARLQRQLNAKLWDDDLEYLINAHQDGSVDTHIYVGSLLAAHFGFIDTDRSAALVKTAKSRLLDERLGIRNVCPMDFHLLVDDLEFTGNETGGPGAYANGGIWPHANGWYALALLAIGQKVEALSFVKRVMTLEGVAGSPNGQPAMYEYRNSNSGDPSVYGKVDKPQFLWAAGWYLYTLYHLLGIRENEWNIALDPYLFEGRTASRFHLFAGGRLVAVSVTGSGHHIRSIEHDAAPYPAAVIPGVSVPGEIRIVLGVPELPYVARTNSILLASRFDRENLRLAVVVKGFPGHDSETQIVSPWPPESVFANGVELNEGWSLQQCDNVYRITVGFSQQSRQDTIEVRFWRARCPRSGRLAGRSQHPLGNADYG